MKNHNLYLAVALGLVPALVTSSSPQPDLARSERPVRRPHISRPLQRHKDSSSPLGPSSVEHIVQGALSSNWAGAVRESPPASAMYTYVAATITVPTPTPTGNSTANQAASAWVGIDGATYTSAILQTGVDFYVIDGAPYTDAWYEWYPDFAHYYDDFAVNPGDVLVASVNATSTSRGVCIVENQTSGQSVTTTVSAPKGTATLQGVNVEWVVEDFQSGDRLVPFAGFDRVQFGSCGAQAAGIEYGLENATVYELMQDGEMLAHVQVVNTSEVVVTRA